VCSWVKVARAGSSLTRGRWWASVGRPLVSRGFVGGGRAPVVCVPLTTVTTVTAVTTVLAAARHMPPHPRRLDTALHSSQQHLRVQDVWAPSTVWRVYRWARGLGSDDEWPLGYPSSIPQVRSVLGGRGRSNPTRLKG
jgi:hypothetical protein